MNELINPNNSNYLTAVATTLLVLVGLAQIFVLFSQNNKHELH